MRGAHRLEFRPDIEGLRALAILLVVADHAGVSWIAGGYTGVDVFFVISGYLITGLLLKEISETGRIDFLSFYLRRLKRLLPALLFMVAVVSLVAGVLLAPDEHGYQASAAAAAAAWLSNLYFAFSNLDYFGPGAEENVFLHTWSLGVEEQFYLLWPALIAGLIGLWRLRSPKLRYDRLLGGMGLVLVASFGLSLILAKLSPQLGFYLMPSRAWQFALGALVFLATGGLASPFKEWPRLEQALRSPAAGWLGLAMIASAAVFLTPQRTYPSGWALVPSLGAALVLLQTTGPRRPAWLLSSAPARGLGRISYSWYLWHWPVLVLGNSAGEPLKQAGLVLASLLLAMLSYSLVEAPVRRRLIPTRWTRWSIGGAVATSLTVVALSIAWGKAATGWAQFPDQRRFQEVRQRLPGIYAMGCDEWFYSARAQACVFGDPNAEKTAVIIGDSIMGQWFPGIARAYDKPGWRLLVLTKSSCPMVDEPYFYERIGQTYHVCSEWREHALRGIAQLQPDAVILGSYAGYPFSREEWVDGSRRILERLARSSKSVFLVRGTYELPVDGPRCLARNHWRPAAFRSTEVCSGKAESAHSRSVYDWLRESASGLDNVKVVDFNSLICPGGRCHAELAGQIIFRDNMHLAADYVESLHEEIAKRLTMGQVK